MFMDCNLLQLCCFLLQSESFFYAFVYLVILKLGDLGKCWCHVFFLTRKKNVQFGDLTVLPLVVCVNQSLEGLFTDFSNQAGLFLGFRGTESSPDVHVEVWVCFQKVQGCGGRAVSCQRTRNHFKCILAA